MPEDRYQILEALGAGGGGTVFKGFDTQLKRQVALKRIMSRNELAGSAAEETNVRREAGALAALQHPNIVKVFDVASTDQGVFVVMELVEGIDLAEWLRNEGRMPLPDFLRLAEELLEALIAAHNQSILHRNIKPKNIMVQRSPTGRLQVKLTGFGLARVSQVARKQTVDHAGNVLGTVHYMAPEQFLRQPLDSRTDLYQLGCVLYETLAGQRAFEAQSLAAVMDKHLKHVLNPLAELRPEASPALCQWVESLLSFEKSARPESARTAMQSLLVIAEESTLPAPPQDDAPRPTPPPSPITEVASSAGRPVQAALSRRPTGAPLGRSRGAALKTRGTAPTPATRKRSALLWPVLSVCITAVIVIATIWMNHPSDTGASVPWEPLFNGTNLTGWRASKDNWMMENGVVHCKPGNRDRGSLDTERKFKNFTLELEFCLVDKSANSGIILPNGYQPDIGPGVTGSVYPGKGGLARPPVLAKVPDPQPGEWHTYRVTVKSPEITVELDGKTTASFTDPNAVKHPMEGPLRLEGGAGVHFRNARVKRL